MAPLGSEADRSQFQCHPRRRQCILDGARRVHPGLLCSTDGDRQSFHWRPSGPGPHVSTTAGIGGVSLIQRVDWLHWMRPIGTVDRAMHKMCTGTASYSIRFNSLVRIMCHNHGYVIFYLLMVRLPEGWESLRLQLGRRNNSAKVKGSYTGILGRIPRQR